MATDSIFQLLPPVEHLDSFEAADLAARIFPELLRRWKQEGKKFSFHNLTMGDDLPRPAYTAMAEALSWLIREGLLVEAPGTQFGWYVPSRRMEAMREPSEFDSYRKSTLFPREQLHPAIAQASFSDFMRGDYDGAVFKAFREVEISVRDASGLTQSDIGVPLVRKAFDPKCGPLSDQVQVESEREALAHLFAGAMGSYKNPSSHRRTVINAEQAIEMIVLASHLRKIVASRQSKP